MSDSGDLGLGCFARETPDSKTGMYHTVALLCVSNAAFDSPDSKLRGPVDITESGFNNGDMICDALAPDRLGLMAPYAHEGVRDVVESDQHRVHGVYEYSDRVHNIDDHNECMILDSVYSGGIRMTMIGNRPRMYVKVSRDEFMRRRQALLLGEKVDRADGAGVTRVSNTDKHGSYATAMTRKHDKYNGGKSDRAKAQQLKHFAYQIENKHGDRFDEIPVVQSKSDEVILG